MSPRLVIVDKTTQAMEGAVIYPPIDRVDAWENCAFGFQLPPCVTTTPQNNPPPGP
jgi:hypothetical protein